MPKLKVNLILVNKRHANSGIIKSQVVPLFFFSDLKFIDLRGCCSILILTFRSGSFPLLCFPALSYNEAVKQSAANFQQYHSMKVIFKIESRKMLNTGFFQKMKHKIINQVTKMFPKFGE